MEETVANDATAADETAKAQLAAFLAHLRWAAWLTHWLCVVLPWGCIVYSVASLYQQTLESWRTGRADHSTPDPMTAVVVNPPYELPEG